MSDKATEQHAPVLAERCAAAYSAARSALLVAAGGVDAWDSAERGDVACATARGAPHGAQYYFRGEMGNVVSTIGTQPMATYDEIALRFMVDYGL